MPHGSSRTPSGYSLQPPVDRGIASTPTAPKNHVLVRARILCLHAGFTRMADDWPSASGGTGSADTESTAIMKTLGIDLSSQPDKSAACVIEWRENLAEILLIKTPLTDDDAVSLARTLGEETRHSGVTASGGPMDMHHDPLRSSVSSASSDDRAEIRAHEGPSPPVAGRRLGPASRAPRRQRLLRGEVGSDGDE